LSLAGRRWQIKLVASSDRLRLMESDRYRPDEVILASPILRGVEMSFAAHGRQNAMKFIPN
jgi:hypothetical protein